MKETKVEDRKSESKNRKITRRPGHVSKIFESVSPASQTPKKIERSKQADIEAKSKAKAEVEQKRLAKTNIAKEVQEKGMKEEKIEKEEQEKNAKIEVERVAKENAERLEEVVKISNSVPETVERNMTTKQHEIQEAPLSWIDYQMQMNKQVLKLVEDRNKSGKLTERRFLEQVYWNS